MDNTLNTAVLVVSQSTDRMRESELLFYTDSYWNSPKKYHN